MKDHEIRTSRDLTPEERQRSLQLSEDQRYLEALKEIEESQERKRQIVEGTETAANFLGHRGFDTKRYYPDLATRMQDLRNEYLAHTIQSDMNLNPIGIEQYPFTDGYLERFRDPYK